MSLGSQLRSFRFEGFGEGAEELDPAGGWAGFEAGGFGGEGEIPAPAVGALEGCRGWDRGRRRVRVPCLRGDEGVELGDCLGGESSFRNEAEERRMTQCISTQECQSKLP